MERTAAVIRRGMPFETETAGARYAAVEGLKKNQFDAEIQLGLDDIAAGRVISSDDVENEMERLYNI